MYKAEPRDNLLHELDQTSPLQPEFTKPVDDVIRHLKAATGSSLHSLYLSGTVAHRSAISGEAELPVLVVVKSALTVTQYSTLNTVRWRMQQGHGEFKRISFDVVTLDQVRDLREIFKWGFMLKHCMICIHGDNLGNSFGHFEVSWDVAKAMNADMKSQLKESRAKIAKASQWSSQLDAAESIAAILIRAALGTVAHRDKNWFDELEPCASRFLHYYPDKALEVERLFYLVERKPVKKRAVVGLIDSFGGWLLDEYAKIDRKIG